MTLTQILSLYIESQVVGVPVRRRQAQMKEAEADIGKYMTGLGQLLKDKNFPALANECERVLASCFKEGIEGSLDGNGLPFDRKVFFVTCFLQFEVLFNLHNPGLNLNKTLRETLRELPVLIRADSSLRFMVELLSLPTLVETYKQQLHSSVKGFWENCDSFLQRFANSRQTVLQSSEGSKSRQGATQLSASNNLDVGSSKSESELVPAGNSNDDDDNQQPIADVVTFVSQFVEFFAITSGYKIFWAFAADQYPEMNIRNGDNISKFLPTLKQKPREIAQAMVALGSDVGDDEDDQTAWKHFVALFQVYYLRAFSLSGDAAILDGLLSLNECCVFPAQFCQQVKTTLAECILRQSTRSNIESQLHRYMGVVSKHAGSDNGEDIALSTLRPVLGKMIQVFEMPSSPQDPRQVVRRPRSPTFGGMGLSVVHELPPRYIPGLRPGDDDTSETLNPRALTALGQFIFYYEQYSQADQRLLRPLLTRILQLVEMVNPQFSRDYLDHCGELNLDGNRYLQRLIDKIKTQQANGLDPGINYDFIGIRFRVRVDSRSQESRFLETIVPGQPPRYDVMMTEPDCVSLLNARRQLVCLALLRSTTQDSTLAQQLLLLLERGKAFVPTAVESNGAWFFPFSSKPPLCPAQSLQALLERVGLLQKVNNSLRLTPNGQLSLEHLAQQQQLERNWNCHSRGNHQWQALGQRYQRHIQCNFLRLFKVAGARHAENSAAARPTLFSVLSASVS